jgi:hypothetical protein
MTRGRRKEAMSGNVLQWSGLWGLVVAVGLALAGCGGVQIQVARAEPVERALDAQSMDLRNCDSPTELRRSLASEVEIDQEVTIADQATAMAGGETAEISPEVKAKLVAEVERAYTQVYEEAKTGVEQTELTVPVARIHTYRIEWKEQVFSSSVSFSMDGETYTAAYTYTLYIPDEAGFFEIGCTA